MDRGTSINLIYLLKISLKTVNKGPITRAYNWKLGKIKLSLSSPEPCISPACRGIVSSDELAVYKLLWSGRPLPALYICGVVVVFIEGLWYWYAGGCCALSFFSILSLIFVSDYTISIIIIIIIITSTIFLLVYAEDFRGSADPGYLRWNSLGTRTFCSASLLQ